MSQMDDVDQQQQREIEALRAKNQEQDTRLGIWTKLYIALFIVVLALFVGGVIAMPLIQKGESDLARPSTDFWCPHEDCLHHRTLKGYASK